MNNRYLWRALGIAALVIAVAAVIGIGAYHAGMAQGIAESRAVNAPAAGSPYVYVWPRPWAFGFFPFFPILFLLLFFGIARGLFWRGPWRGGCGYYGYDRVPPQFDEWHRRAHGERPAPENPGSTT